MVRFIPFGVIHGKEVYFLISGVTQDPQKDFIVLVYYGKCALHKDYMFSATMVITAFVICACLVLLFANLLCI